MLREQRYHLIVEKRSGGNPMQQDDRLTLAKIGPRDAERLIAQAFEFSCFLSLPKSLMGERRCGPCSRHNADSPIYIKPNGPDQYCSDFSETSWYQRLRVPIFARIFQPNVFGAVSMACRSPFIRPRMTPSPLSPREGNSLR
jgi:hypothetical protein